MHLFGRSLINDHDGTALEKAVQAHLPNCHYFDAHVVSPWIHIIIRWNLHVTERRHRVPLTTADQKRLSSKREDVAWCREDFIFFPLEEAFAG